MKMKTRNKIMLLALCMVALIAVSVLGTMAYLTSKDTVTNTFTVGNVTITLDEAKVNVDGEKLYVPADKTETVGFTGYVTESEGNAPAKRVSANEYKLMPGHFYTKDPTVHVDANSENCYLFVKVTDDIATYEDDTTIADQLKANGWEAVTGKPGVYVYTQNNEKAAVAGGTDVAVFASFKLKDDADVSKINKDTAKIEITAYAIQADGFTSKTPADIWDAAKFE